MTLKMGSSGPDVRQLQENLNRLLAPGQRPLATDAIYGPQTKARVQGFQGGLGLTPDGIFGPLTLQALLDALQRLGPSPVPPQPASTTRLITDEILGTFPSVNNLIVQVIPSISLIDTTTFRPGDVRNELRFRFSPMTTGRLAIFACGKGGVERAVILLLPALTKPDRIAICITQGFAQASKTLNPLHWENPLSPDLIKFCLLKHVVNRFGAQALASRKNIGLMYIVRAKGKELGPFANDGAFVKQCLTEMAALTNDSFSFAQVETFTFSSGISDFNPFLGSIANVLNVGAVYSIDPAGAEPAGQPTGAIRKQYLSGQTGGFPGGIVKHGFEPMILNRWKNEGRFGERNTLGLFNYLHNHVMPSYILNLALDT